MMTVELYLKLKKYEQIFRTAIDSNYYRAMDSRFAADFIGACKELNVYVNPSCPQCVLKALLAVGKLYFDFRIPEQPAVADSSDKSEPQLNQTKSDNKTINKLKKVSLNVFKRPLKTKSK